MRHVYSPHEHSLGKIAGCIVSGWLALDQAYGFRQFGHLNYSIPYLL